MLGEDPRQVRYELLVGRLVRLSQKNKARLVCLSALLPSGQSLQDFVSWIRDDEDGEPVRSQWRPTRQRFAIAQYTGNSSTYRVDDDPDEITVTDFVTAVELSAGRKKSRRFPRESWDWVFATTWKLLDRRSSAMIYCPQKRSVVAGAKHLMKLLDSGALRGFDDPLTEVETSLLLEYLPADHPVAACLRVGVVVLHADVPRAVQRCMFRILANKSARLIVASPIIGQGIDLAVSIVVFQSLFNAGSLIKQSEFGNVAGRAGRAFADIDGQIVYVTSGKYIKDWKTLHRGLGDLSLLSGILLNITRLLDALHSRFETIDTAIIDRIIELDAVESVEDESLVQQLDDIDGALLQLIEEDGYDPIYASENLDEIFRSTLLAKKLRRRSDGVQSLIKSFLAARISRLAKYTSQQRRAAYLNAVRLRTLSGFEDLKKRVRPTIDEIEGIVNAEEHHYDSELIASRLVGLADEIFAFPDFTPKGLASDWMTVTRNWLLGASVATLVPEQLSFVEGALRFSLATALESFYVPDEPRSAVRIGSFFACGTILLSALFLLQDGMASREAAIVVAETIGTPASSRSEFRGFMRRNGQSMLRRLDRRTAMHLEEFLVGLRSSEDANQPTSEPVRVATVEGFAGDAWLFADGSITSTSISLQGTTEALPTNVPANGLFGTVKDGWFEPAVLRPVTR